MQAPHEGLLQPNQRAPWPDLSAMGVAGELQIDAKKGGLVDGDGLMGQQHDGARPITPGLNIDSMITLPACFNGQCYLSCGPGSPCPYAQRCVTFDTSVGLISLCTPTQ
jgi:hypothetical protein